MKKIKTLIPLKLIFIAIFIVIFHMAPLHAQAQMDAINPGHSFVKVPINSQADREILYSLGLDIAEISKYNAVAFLQPDDLQKLVDMGFDCQVVVEDANSMFRAMGRVARGAYHSTQETYDSFREAARNNPDICELEIIGKSHEGRDILAMKIGKKSDENRNKPGCLVLGMHHAREWITVEVAAAIMRELVENYPADARIKNLVDNRNIWIVPIVNPDGYEHSLNNYQYWRKNRRKNENGTYGVDPNRNYGYKWGSVGSSSNPSADTYNGPYAFSEPETCAVRDLASRENFAVSLSYHSYGELILWPWSYTRDTAPDDALLGAVARAIAKENGYKPQKSSGLYPSMGDTDDFLYGVTGCFGFTVELGRTFIPSVSDIDKICAKNVASALLLFEKADSLKSVADFDKRVNSDLEQDLNMIREIADSMVNSQLDQDDLLIETARLESLCDRLADRFVKLGTKQDFQVLDQMIKAGFEGMNMVYDRINEIKGFGNIF